MSVEIDPISNDSDVAIGALSWLFRLAVSQ